MKRAFDFVVALFGLVVLAPFLLLAMCAIRLESPGPAIFAQKRVGRGGGTFTFYKLRSMRSDTAEQPTHLAGAAVLTRLGPFLRRSKLDELPQLWNVVRGDMSLVGPRPCLPSQIALIEARRREGALSVKPGMTGLAQVQKIDMSDPIGLARVDGAYARGQSFRGDLRLLALTLGGAGLGFDAARPDDGHAAPKDR